MKLHLRKLGEGRPILILHGLFGSGDNWLAVARKFSEKGFGCLLPDARNHGLSPHSEVWDIPSMAGDAAELLEDQGMANAICLGHSMGGKVAMQLAASRPDLVRALIIADVAPRAYEMRPMFQTILTALENVRPAECKDRREADERMSAFIPEKSLRDFLLKNLTSSENENGTHYRWKMNLNVIQRDLEKIGRPPPAESRFEGPAFFIYGEASDYVRPEDHAVLLSHFPKAELFGIPGAGHWLHAEAPEIFIRETLRFLKSLPS